MIRDAIFSDDRKYRYLLYRQWGVVNSCTFIMLNASSADEYKDDPTVRRCIGFAKSWGFGSLYIVNLFAFVATEVKDLYAAVDPIGPANDMYLKTVIQDAPLAIAAWGTHGAYLNRGKEIWEKYPHLKYLKLTKEGHPGHPLYLKADLIPQERR